MEIPWKTLKKIFFFKLNVQMQYDLVSVKKVAKAFIFANWNEKNMIKKISRANDGKREKMD